MQLNTKEGIAVFGDYSEGDFEIIFTGDLCFRNRPEKLVLDGKSKDILSEVMPVLNNADLSIVNMEAALTRRDTPIKKCGPNLKDDPGCVEFIKEAEFDVAVCANNHTGDFGPEGALDTKKVLDENNIANLGVGSNEDEARKPLIVEKAGMKIAFLAYAENEFGIATNESAGSNPLKPLRNIKDIKAAKKQADITIVLIHGGNEHNPIPSPRMKETYRAFAEAGADAVVAGHTHCPQGFEIWEGVPVVYSLGNFYFDVDKAQQVDFPTKSFWWMGYMCKISFTNKKASKVEIIPYTFGPDAAKIKLFKDQKREDFFVYLNKLSEILADDPEAEKYWNAWCVSMGTYQARMSGMPEWPVDLSDEENFRKLLSARNLHTCEAHNELVTRLFYLAVAGKLDEAEKYVDKLNQLKECVFLD
jgi:poly-gamma-glutamate synthesis protein (capsule biosynthesis protein)